MSKNEATTLIRKVYRLAKPYGRKKLAVVFLIMFVQGLSQVVGVTSIFPFLALASDPGRFRESEHGSWLFTYLPELSDRWLLVCAGSFAIAMLVSSNALMLLGEVVSVRYSQGLGHWLRQQLLTRMVSNPYSYFLQRNTGELLKKSVQDVGSMVSNVLLPALDGFSRFLTVLFLITTLFFIDPILAGSAVLLLGTFYAAVFIFLKHRREQLSNRMWQADRGAMREVQQLLGGIKPIKVHQSESTFLDRYSSHSACQSVLRKWIPIYQNTPKYLVEPLAFGGMVAAVVLLAARGDNFSDLIPKLGVMALAGYRLLPNLQYLYFAASGISMNRHSVEEVYEEFQQMDDAECRIAHPSQPPQPLEWNRSIRIEGLTFQYVSTSEPLFDRLELEIRKNQFVAFVGATGSGKSTLVDLILGLHEPTAGVISIDDRPLDDVLLPAWRASLGYVPQEIFLLDDTIAANIAFGLRAEAIDYDRVAEVARVAQIADFIERRLPKGYRSDVGERGVRLSGGQRQRIGLARALYHRPTTLVLDEATSALDDGTEAALMQAIEAMHGAITLIVIAHRLTTIERADRLFILEHGRLIDQGTFEETRVALRRPATPSS